MKNKTFLMSLPLLITALATSCSPKHTHTFGEEWKHDDDNHWHECADDGVKDGVAAHEWGEGEVTTAPTCTEDGVRTYTCICGATKTEPVAQTGHQAASEWQSDSNNHWHNCTHNDCYEELDKAAHTFEEDASRRVEASCTAKGKKFLVCSVCGEEKTEDIPTNEHAWNNGEITTQPTCDSTGVRTYTCSTCGRTREEVIDATGHDWQSKSSGDAYQFNSNGTWEECSVCHAKRNEVVNETAPWAIFDLDNESNVVCQNPDPSAYDRDTHTLTTSKYQKDDGVKFTLSDTIDSTRLVLEVTVTVDGQTSWGAQASFHLLDDEGKVLGSVFCLKANPLYDSAKYTTQFRTTVLENGAPVTALSAQGAEFTYRFDFRGFEKAPRSFVINGANGQAATPDIICVKSIVAKETLCGHKATEVALGTSVASTCKTAGYEQYVCGHEGCGNVEYRVEKELAQHTPQVVTGGTEAFKYEFGGNYTICSECGEVLDDSGSIVAPWAKVSNDKITLNASSVSTNSAHTPTRTEEDGAVYFRGYYNGGLDVDTTSAANNNRNILSLTMKPTTWKWGGYCFYMYIYAGSAKVLSTTQFYSGTMAKWIEMGGKIYDESGAEVGATSVSANAFFTFEIDLSSYLAEGAQVTRISVVSGYDADDSSTEFANCPTLGIKDVTFKQTYCGHAPSEIEEKSMLSNATCATSVVDYCNACNKIVGVKSTTMHDGCTKQDLGTVNGVRGSSSVYNKETYVINDTCTNQFGPMFAVGADVDEAYIEMEVLSGETPTIFCYVNSAEKDISWADRYAFDLTPSGYTNINNPAHDLDLNHLMDSQGQAISTFGVGDTIVLKLDIGAMRTAGYGATMILLGTKNATAVKLNALVYHTAS